MNFSLDYTAEQQEFQKQVDAWLNDNFPRDLKLPSDFANLSHEQYQKLRELGRKLGEKGWLAPAFPKEYGGGGLSPEHGIVIGDSLNKHGVSLPPYYDPGHFTVAPAILAWGTDEQKRRFIPAILRGEVTTWQLFTEPEAGSDLAGVQTVAVRSGKYFTINGQKAFVGGSYKAEQFWLLARTDPKGARRKNLGMFVVPSDAAGITIHTLDLIATGVEAGTSAGKKNMVFLDDVQVPETCLIGGENNGWAVANTTLEVEHGGGESIVRNRMIERFLQFCMTNVHIQNRLKQNPELVADLVDIYISDEIDYLFTLRNYWLSSTDGSRAYEGPQLSLWRKMEGLKLVNVIIKVLGPYALTNDPHWAPEDGLFEYQQRSGLVTAPGGTVEIIKLLMARGLGTGRIVT